MTWQNLTFLLLLAQDGQGPAPDAGSSDGLMRFMFPLTMFLILIYFFFIRPQKKKDDEFRDMVANLKEKDRVVTVGGIHGVVTNVRRDVEQVVIRVDETNGTRLHIGLNAIARVVTDDKPDDSAKAEDKTNPS